MEDVVLNIKNYKLHIEGTNKSKKSISQITLWNGTCYKEIYFNKLSPLSQKIITDSIQRIVEKPLCTIVNGKHFWIMTVDDQEICFVGYHIADYFAKHYRNIGYKVIFIKTQQD